jgi:RimJ/RimL family protein N-acetyltransferase
MSANETLLRLDTLRFRRESDDDRAFRYRLFRDSRPGEWERLPLDATFGAQLMRLQFEAQTSSFRTQFPDARFDIVELADEPIGRIVVDRPGTMLRLVDLALVPRYRNRGIGTAILAALIDEAQAVQLTVRLAVAAGNEGALRLYRRLGFVAIATTEMQVELERRPSVAQRKK